MLKYKVAKWTSSLKRPFRKSLLSCARPVCRHKKAFTKHLIEIVKYFLISYYCYEKNTTSTQARDLVCWKRPRIAALFHWITSLFLWNFFPLKLYNPFSWSAIWYVVSLSMLMYLYIKWYFSKRFFSSESCHYRMPSSVIRMILSSVNSENALLVRSDFEIITQTPFHFLAFFIILSVTWQ